MSDTNEQPQDFNDMDSIHLSDDEQKEESKTENINPESTEEKGEPVAQINITVDETPKREIAQINVTVDETKQEEKQDSPKVVSEVNVDMSKREKQMKSAQLPFTIDWIAYLNFSVSVVLVIFGIGQMSRGIAKAVNHADILLFISKSVLGIQLTNGIVYSIGGIFGVIASLCVFVPKLPVVRVIASIIHVLSLVLLIIFDTIVERSYNSYVGYAFTHHGSQLLHIILLFFGGIQIVKSLNDYDNVKQPLEHFWYTTGILAIYGANFIIFSLVDMVIIFVDVGKAVQSSNNPSSPENYLAPEGILALFYLIAGIILLAPIGVVFAKMIKFEKIAILGTAISLVLISIYDFVRVYIAYGLGQSVIFGRIVIPYEVILFWVIPIIASLVHYTKFDEKERTTTKKPAPGTPGGEIVYADVK